MLSKDQSALLEIAENIELAQRWTAELSLEAFAEDRKTFYAVTRCLEIISEASRKLSADCAARAPHIDWRAVRDAGNLYRHQYASVDEDRTLSTVRESLWVLAAFAHRELAD